MNKENVTRYAVVDLEATGTSATAKIIQVGIVILENGNIVDSYESDVNPHEPLTDHIKELTGLTDERLAVAPSFSQVAKPIFELLDGAIFVAHNVKFDANLLAEELFMEGYELRSPLVDTVELSQIFFPTLERYNLSTLSSVLGIELADAHTAIADARATAQVFVKLQEKIASLPKLTLEKISEFSDQLLFESRIIIDNIFQSKKNAKMPDDLVEVGGILVKKSPNIVPRRQMSQEFEMNIALLDLEARELQAQFAEIINNRFEEGGYSFVEAPAGIGKTYAYLLPVLAKKNAKQLVVSVPTKALQDQIMANEVHRLKELFNITSQSLKSPQNYIKLDKFWETLQVVDDNRIANRYKMQLLVWLCETQTGDLDEIRQKQRLESFFEAIQHDGNISETSLFTDVDFWKRHKERAKSCQLVITNHAYLLSRVADDKSFIENKVLVVDEAQQFFLQLEEFSRAGVSLKNVLEEISACLSQSPTTLNRRLLEGLQFEINDLAQDFTLTKNGKISTVKKEQMKLYLAELDLPILDGLRQVLANTYTQFWIEEESYSDFRTLLLKSARLDFMSLSTVFPQLQKAFFVSATIQIGSGMNLASLLDVEQYSFDRLETSVNREQMVFIDSSMPSVGDVSEGRYAFEIAERLRELLRFKLPIVVLFTANKMLLMVSDILEEWGISHLCQHKHGLAGAIKKRFDRGSESLLLGSGSFWEGMDFVQQDQTICVVVRLPFDNPSSMFSQKIEHHVRFQGKDPFQQYSLPMTTLRLKQAIGRTKRRDNQQSLVVILDSRLVTKSYGKSIIDFLSSQSVVTAEKFPQILREIGYFFEKDLI